MMHTMLSIRVQKQEIANWFRAVMACSGMSARQWAEKAKTSSSNITRLSKDPDSAAMPKPETLVKLAMAVPPEVSVRPPEFIQKLLPATDVYDARGAIDLPLSPIEIIGHVQAGEWREIVDFDTEDRHVEYLPVPDEYRNTNVFGTVTRGTSMNRVFPDGTTLMCVPVTDYPHGIGHEDFVLVQRRSVTGSVEITVKQLMIDETNRPWLWPRSDDPRWQAPIEIPLNHDDHHHAEEAEIVIKAVVVRAFADTVPRKKQRRLLDARLYRKK